MTPKENAEAHWEYVKGVLAVHGVQEDEMTIIGHHYVTAFCHGYKHGVTATIPNAALRNGRELPPGTLVYAHMEFQG